MKVMTINMENFKEEVLDHKNPILLDFWAEWCGPCKALAPILEEIAKELPEGMRVGKINVDENQALAQEFRVMSIPTVIFFKGGEALQRFVGLRDKDDYIETMKTL